MVVSKHFEFEIKFSMKYRQMDFGQQWHNNLGVVYHEFNSLQPNVNLYAYLFVSIFFFSENLDQLSFLLKRRKVINGELKFNNGRGGRQLNLPPLLVS